MDKIQRYKEMLLECHDNEFEDTEQWYINFIRENAALDGNWGSDKATMHDVCIDIIACAAILVNMHKDVE